ncbi:alpha/beta hydrolase [Phytoactinopolyspora alkaliphila]|uniref:Alpha/beta hydrolase n=1 Tax=Phytoactinopolyspora alkaliphila TaxID=1783498 RepID=A0A6N9YQ89_9ACTN|nr:alpha/beta hydrolase [Phytoactinopolyspora alkaliphila]NED97216.1 alpha/beta hydrolase [Phytoactinopolyspora alkaliphila]
MTSTTVRERELNVEGIRTVLREAGPVQDDEAVVFIHGNPGSGADWIGLMDRVSGFRRVVAWDAPGFGRSGKPADFPYTVDGYASFIAKALDSLGVGRAHLVLHDFGGPWGLQWAVDHADRFASAVLINTGVLLGYRWHRLARVWRTAVAGEAFMVTATRTGFRMLMGVGNPRGLPREFVDRMYDDFDHGTRRAVLRLYRATDLARWADRASPELARLNRPALVVWGTADPYIPAAQAGAQLRSFPRAETLLIDGSGHWPFIDAPERVEPAVAEFLQRVAAT